MLSPVVKPPGLVTGERLTVEEFLRRWEELPELKNAELIDGVVYLSSPVSLEHGDLDSQSACGLGIMRRQRRDAGCSSTDACSRTILSGIPPLLLLPLRGDRFHGRLHLLGIS
jgi:Uma2 family endonuclease